MPIFEYRCKKCGKITEDFSHKNPPKSHICEFCGSQATRVMSVFQGPEQMRGMIAIRGGQKFVKARRDWRLGMDEGKRVPPPR